MKRPDVSVVVPSYNEAETLQRTLPELYAHLKTLPWTVELIVGDDGSTDNEKQLIKTFIRTHPNTRYEGYPKNRGKGGILTYCLRRAKGRRVVFIDADLAIEKSLIAAVVRGLEAADIVIASKHAKGARVAYPLIRTITSYGFSIITRLLFGVPVSDFQCGLKGFREDVLDAVLPAMTSVGFLWDTEFLVRSHRKHYKIVEIPAIVHPEGRKSKVRVFRDTWRMFWGLVALARKLHATG